MGLLDSACAQVVIDADVADPAKRQHGISYVQLKCSVDPSDFVHGAQDVASSPIQFCLQLPAHSRSSVSIISLIHSPAKKPSSVNSAAQPSALSSARQHLFAPAGFSTPVRPPIQAAQDNGLTPPSVRGSTTGTPTTSSIGVLVAASPNFQSFLSDSSASETSVTGYFGELKFLDDQHVFQDTFGVQPMILPFWPNDPAKYPKEALVALSDQYYLRCFWISVSSIMLVKNQILTITNLSSVAFLPFFKDVLNARPPSSNTCGSSSLRSPTKSSCGLNILW